MYVCVYIIYVSKWSNNKYTVPWVITRKRCSITSTQIRKWNNTRPQKSISSYVGHHPYLLPQNNWTFPWCIRLACFKFNTKEIINTIIFWVQFILLNTTVRYIHVVWRNTFFIFISPHFIPVWCFTTIHLSVLMLMYMWVVSC